MGVIVDEGLGVEAGKGVGVGESVGAEVGKGVGERVGVGVDVLRAWIFMVMLPESNAIVASTYVKDTLKKYGVVSKLPNNTLEALPYQ